MEELRRALADAKAARLQGEATIRSRSPSRSPETKSSPPSQTNSRSFTAAERQRLVDADASALYSRAEQAIEARRRQISSFRCCRSDETVH